MRYCTTLLSVAVRDPTRDSPAVQQPPPTVVDDARPARGAGDAAREAAERVAFAANAAPTLLAYFDSSARYVWVNERYLRWFGLPREAIIGRHPSEVLGAAVWDRVQPYAERALAGEEVTFDNRAVFDGQPRDVRVSYVPHRDGSGRVRGIVALVSDISEMKAVERAL